MKTQTVIASAVVSIAATIATATPASAALHAEGCIAVPLRHCSYVATRPGGLLASGSPWRVEIVRRGRMTMVTDWYQFNQIGGIKPGDHVSAWAGIRGLLCVVPQSAAVVRVGSSISRS